MRSERRWANYKPREDPDEELHHFRRLDSCPARHRHASFSLRCSTVFGTDKRISISKSL